MSTSPLSSRVPTEIAEALDLVCRRFRLKKNLVVAAALREKIEEIFDAEDLREAITSANGFHDWTTVRAEHRRRGRR
ncbi:MAG: hypothetical protein QME96_04105 [Myxococcota bacterium]|nr:hypothetical protein [Myxococcota bacterium]